jgi:hypothetical protein
LARRCFLVGLAGLASVALVPLRGSARSVDDSALVEARLVAGAALAQSTEMLTHVHGLAYSADGKMLMVPSHDGLAIYERGKWHKAPGPQHDYMGFASTRQYLYASGHPAPGFGVANPFGLIRSRDGGRSWDKLGLEGEINFFLLAAGWNTNAVYVWNPQPNSRMNNFGVYYTLDEGQTWHAAAAVGLDGELQTLAAHPYAAGTVAIGTSEGAFLSRDFGSRFEVLARDAPALALHFDLDGERLWLGSFAGTAYLLRVNLRSGTIEPAPTPHWGRDPVSYIAQNPASRAEYAIATLGRSVYLSKNGARTWTQIADRGRVR